MDAPTTLIVIALVAWAMQICLGLLQLKAFNRMLQQMSLKGIVKIGKTSSRWRPRTLVVLAHDANGVIVDARTMRGLTVFTRPKPLSELVHARLPLSDHCLATLDAPVREALVCALSTK
ncbi:transcriptional regulator GutM [Pseudaeromonas sp. ZJS20]|uniref:transcriptional regulator GutM n=1 Tax=Pseudaeromonas aegiceratis TaxID=3153928 RepID=UPI00390CD750